MKSASSGEWCEFSEFSEWCEFPETTVLRIYPNEARQLAYLLNQAADIQDGKTVEIGDNYYTRKKERAEAFWVGLVVVQWIIHDCILNLLPRIPQSQGRIKSESERVR